MKYDDIEQIRENSRKFNLEFHSIPEQQDEDIVNIVLELAEVLKVELQEDDINICHCLAQVWKVNSACLGLYAI